jgi:NhaA family Na+:H+ antiporter
MRQDSENAPDSISGPLEKGFTKLVTPFQRFIRDQKTASAILITCTIIALLIANSPLAHWYNMLVETNTGFVFGEWSLQKSLRHWVNDGLMAIFFFILGLEIKREILVGELKDPQRSIPVIAAAAGGMLFPALIYFSLNYSSSAVHGWGIPMATDTAFAVGVLALLGSQVPISITVFLTALAIIDDIGTILVIALFYTDTISLLHLSIAAILLLLLVLCNALGVRRPSIYFLVGGLIWLAMLKSGVHATIAGILVAFTIPARPKVGQNLFLQQTRQLVDEFESIENSKQTDEPILAEQDKHLVLEQVEDTAAKASTPLQRWERALEYPVALFVLPVFALVNAGIPVDTATLPVLLTDPITLGIVFGLTLGKSIGIPLLCWITLRVGWGRLPDGMLMHHVVGIGLLGGMGFTMSIFIAGLSFAQQADMLLAAKTAILLASLLAGIGGYIWLRFCSSLTRVRDISDGR